MSLKKITYKQVSQQIYDLKNCKTKQHIAKLLQVPSKEFSLLSLAPTYYHFTIPKKNGSLRHIEAPSKALKQVQRKLNTYLQAIYYVNQSKSAYGYIIKPVGKTHQKGILNNALQHLGCKYLMNIDFEDFFHQITYHDVVRIFNSNLFNLDKATCQTLAKLCTYKGRLPMGAPTSPALSNLYTLALDKEMFAWAQKQQITYTRFVDDLSFSSKTNPLNESTFAQAQRIAQRYHLNFNPDKTKFLNEQDTKTVTGLVLNATVDIDDQFYVELQKDIERLKVLTEVYTITGQSLKNTAVVKFKQEITGKINFIKTIEGANSNEYQSQLESFLNAQCIQNDLVTRWDKFSSYE